MQNVKKLKLVIVESPSKAKTINKFLGKNYKVIASQGHVRDLPKSQLGVEPENDYEMKYITIRGRGDILAAIRKEAKAASEVLLATDPDREGEAISWHLANLLHIDPGSLCRVEFHEITKKAVKEALCHPRAINMDLVDAQQARRALDRLVGYQISPLLWVKIKKGLSAGRVQSAALRMVADREEEIDSFIPEEYWDVSALFEAKSKSKHKMTCRARLAMLDGNKAEIHSSEEAEAAKKRIEKASFRISNVKSGEKLRKPQAPFTTSSLQQEASRKLNFSTAKTMQVIQQLYEGIDIGKHGTVGLVTYIRTDSVRVSEEALQAARQTILDNYGQTYCPDTPNVYKGRKDAQDAHEAIRPTDLTLTPDEISEHMTKDQANLYKLVYRRFLASQMTSAVFQTLNADLISDDIVLKYGAEHLSFDGYRKLYTESTDDETEPVETQIPVLENDQEAVISSVEGLQHFTQPAPRFTEASLVKAMEDAGIGRPSTYAPTITTIIARGYVSKEKKRLYPTELGKMVTSVMVDHFNTIVDTDFTASLENRLDSVEDGGVQWKQILRDFYPSFKQMLDVAENQVEKIEVKDEVSDIPCEKCGALMVYKMGRYGKFLACPNFPTCTFTMPILHYIDAPCPKCGKRLLEKTTRKNRRFYGCEGYPECDFTSWDMPIAQKCPKCNSYMVKKTNSKGTVVRLCANENCRYKEQEETSGEEM